MTARTLAAHQLASRCDPAALAGTAAPGARDGIVGQERARAAVRLAIDIAHPRWHLFVMGPPGSGKRSLVREAIAARLDGRRVERSDWVYVNNFAEPHKPVALKLPAGRGGALRADLKALIEELRTTIPAAFDSEEYATALERLNAEFKERTEHSIVEVGDEASKHGIVMIHTPVGFTFAPRKGNEVMSPDEFEALPPEERERLQKAVAALQEQLLHALRASVRLRKEHADRVRTLNRETSQLSVDHALDETQSRYTDLPEVAAWLEAVRLAVIDNADAFRAREESSEGGHPQAGDLARYEVNLVVDASAGGDSGVVEADLPTVPNLVGRVDHVAHFGMLVTDFRHIKAGLLHRANGGYLLLDAVKLLTQPFAWNALKRALLKGEARIESLAEMFSVISTIQLEPMPIPLDVKVVLFGEREICRLLQAFDPEFDELFRVVADLDDDLPRADATQRALASTLSAQAAALALLPPADAALARLVDHAARRSGDATRLSAGVRHLLDVLHEADHVARCAGRAGIEAADVGAAIAARRERAARVDARLREAILRDLLAIATTGEQVGQINGLAAYAVGDEEFGLPSRITATTRLGDGQVVDIQRETRMGGPIHAKGVMILGSFLAARFSRLAAFSLAASLVFEQTYGLVEGDSASLAELLALISSIGRVPLRQGLAVTGSVDQFGNVQAIGAVNEKAEGFFDLCLARGLDGTQGVVIPASNVSQLMLREDLVEAVRAGRFAMHAVATVDEALEVFTGLPAGEPGAPRENTVNGRVARRLAEWSALRRGEPRPGRRRAAKPAAVQVRKEEET